MKSCVFCGGSIQRKISLQFIFSFQPVNDPSVCLKCAEQFEQLQGQVTCPGCQRIQKASTSCRDCEQWSKRYNKIQPNHHALYLYNEKAREYMARFKFQGDVLLGALFKDLICEALKKRSQTHLIVPIPMSEVAKKRRGFNPVEVFLREAKIPYVNMLTHVGVDKKQSSKTKEERLLTPQPFQLIEKEMPEFGRPILIVDDVYTTGRTIFHARALLEAKGETSSFSIFR